MKNKVVIVTGAGRGIGKAIALAFAGQGATVVATARSVDEIEDVAAATGGVAIPCDVSAADSIQALIDQTMEQFGRIDVLVNNAGAVARLPTHELSVEAWDHVVNVNLRAVFICSKLALPHMFNQGSGCIINIASIAGVVGPPNRSAYSASKHGVMGLTKTMSAEYLHRGVRVHVILPGATVSLMRGEGFPDEDPDSLIQAEDIADATLFLASQKTTAYTMEMQIRPGRPKK